MRRTCREFNFHRAWLPFSSELNIQIRQSVKPKLARTTSLRREIDKIGNEEESQVFRQDQECKVLARNGQSCILSIHLSNLL